MFLLCHRFDQWKTSYSATGFDQWKTFLLFHRFDQWQTFLLWIRFWPMTNFWYRFNQWQTFLLCYRFCPMANVLTLVQILIIDKRSYSESGFDQWQISDTGLTNGKRSYSATGFVQWQTFLLWYRFWSMTSVLCLNQVLTNGKLSDTGLTNGKRSYSATGLTNDKRSYSATDFDQWQTSLLNYRSCNLQFHWLK